MPKKKPFRKMNVYVIDSRYQPAADTIDLRGKKGGKKILAGAMLDLNHYNRYKDTPDNPYKDPGDSMYTISPTMWKEGEMIRHQSSISEHIKVHRS